jgi:hypothetical protein
MTKDLTPHIDTFYQKIREILDKVSDGADGSVVMCQV